MKQTRSKDLSGLTLHLLAMAFMLCDHLWATIIPGNTWLTWVGRLAFPIYAFLLVEGYHHTRDFRKYLKRMVLFALVSELPFNLLVWGNWIFPFHQNVLWTFTLGLLCMKSIDTLRHKLSPWLAWPLAAAVAWVFALLGQLLMVDYHDDGIWTILVFCLFRGYGWKQRLGQLAGMVLIHGYLMGGVSVPLTLFGWQLEIPQQSMAVLALLPIWAYRGRQGYASKGMQLLRYGFYPAHLLILGLLARY